MYVQLFRQRHAFTALDKFTAERFAHYEEEFKGGQGQVVPWRWHYYFREPSTLKQVSEVVAEGIELFLDKNKRFLKAQTTLSRVA